MDRAAFDDFFEPELARTGMRGVLTGRPDRPDGCAVFFDSSLWALDDTLDSVVHIDLGMQKANVGQVVFLRSVEGSPDIRCAVINTHLLYSPKRGDIKLAQLAMVTNNKQLSPFGLSSCAREREREGKKE
jgi:hypothetical protein